MLTYIILFAFFLYPMFLIFFKMNLAYEETEIWIFFISKSPESVNYLQIHPIDQIIAIVDIKFLRFSASRKPIPVHHKQQ